MEKTKQNIENYAMYYASALHERAFKEAFCEAFGYYASEMTPNIDCASLVDADYNMDSGPTIYPSPLI